MPARLPTRRIAMVAFDGAQTLDVTGPLEVFARASRFMADIGVTAAFRYETLLVANKSGSITTSSGLKIHIDRAVARVHGPIDTLLVSGGPGTTSAMEDRDLIRWIARVAQKTRRVCSVCTGTFLLARAGLLDGRRATTHWRWCDALARQFPRVNVETDPIYVQDGNFVSSAGVTAGIDLALALVEEDCGRDIALGVARELVMFIRRPGGQSQFSAQLAVQSADRQPIRQLQSYIAEHPNADLSVPAMARRAAMSARNFSRVFARETGMTPADYVESLRLEAARRRLEESNETVDAIAHSCGLGTRESMRRAFIRKFRVPPGAYRSRFRSAAPSHKRSKLGRRLRVRGG